MHGIFKYVPSALVAAGLVGLVGCDGGPEVARVGGTVTYKGKPVTGGSLTFLPQANGNPMPGKPASAVVQEDGTYTLATLTADDGAVVGKHQINYSPPVLPFPPGKDPPQGASPPPSGFEGLAPKTAEVEVQSGSNTIDIELVPMKR